MILGKYMIVIAAIIFVAWLIGGLLRSGRSGKK
jgi:hypothetical protein